MTSGANIRVTNSGDHGAGSLREAILAADRARNRARIDLLVGKVEITEPLPPLINPKGITLGSSLGQTTINASQVASGAVLQVLSKDVSIHGIRIENAAQDAIVAGAMGLQISKSTFANCGTAVEIVDGGGDLVVEDSTFDKNQIGLQTDNFERNVTVRRSKFLSQAQAGIWAVSQGGPDEALTLDIGGNQFSDNRFGIVTANHQVHIYNNDISLSHEAGVQLFGRGATVEHNRISDGAAAGVQADSTSDIVIGDNEIYRNRTVAIVLKNSSGATIRANNIYSNGNGIAFVLGRSNSPNTAIQNSIFSQTGEGVVIVGQQPVLTDNSVRSNNTRATSQQVVLPMTTTTLPFDVDKTAAPYSSRSKAKGGSR